MLAELRITNFALIDSLQLEFPSGFLVFTGETGTGKSLLVDALLLLIGERASSDQIRFEADEAILEARFFVPPSHPVTGYLREHCYLLDDQLELVVRRILSRTGRNRIYMNGQMVPLQVLQEVGIQLIDIHGQHDQQSLLNSKTQLKLLDAFGNLEGLVEQYQKVHRDWNEAKKTLEEFQQKFLDGGKRRDMLRFQYDELTAIRLQAGEETTLSEEYHRLKHGGRLGELSILAFRLLYEDDQSILGKLKEVKQTIGELGELDSRGKTWSTFVDAAETALRELTVNLREYREQMEYDPERMDVIDNRLASIQRVKKKYGKTVNELMVVIQELEQELDLLDRYEEEKAKRQTLVANRELVLKEIANDLSARRKKTAQELVRRVKKEFEALNMGTLTLHVKIEVSDNIGTFGSAGADRIEMLIAPNPGEPPHSLGRVASGGELSRIMLALKTVFAGNDRTPVVIFDEIDSGVGGEAGIIMGGRLRRLAQFHQVCCITHLPQIAAQAHTQFVVEKTTAGNRTLTRVRPVTGKDREAEIARMLGGGTLTPTIRQTASELLERGQSTAPDSAAFPPKSSTSRKKTGKS